MSVEAKNDNKNKKKTDFIDILNTVVNDKLKDHEKMRTHACSVLGELLTSAPEDAHVFDVLFLTFRTCRRAGLPPGLGSMPGKQLILLAYEEYCFRYPDEVKFSSEESKDRKKAAMEEWTEINELCLNGLTMMLRRVTEIQAK